MRRSALFAAALAAALAAAVPASAVEPDEILADPALEARARDLSRGLRCLVCRNESIDESRAPLARDLRLLLRERLVAGDSDEAAIAYIVDRYGEYVLLNPTRQGANLMLWFAGPALLVGGVAVAGTYVARRRRAAEPETALTPEEEARLEVLMRGNPGG